MARRMTGCNKTDCVYRSENAGVMVTCDYILYTGESRGCGIGDDCDKYKPGIKRKKWMNEYWYRSRKR